MGVEEQRMDEELKRVAEEIARVGKGAPKDGVHFANDHWDHERNPLREEPAEVILMEVIAPAHEK